MSSVISRVFMNGNIQAVQIPNEFKLDASRVEIYRNAEGDLVLHPVAADRGAALLQAFDQDFVDLLTADKKDVLLMQDRESL